jgi:hypothetical protein
MFPTFLFNAKAARIEVRIVTGPRTGRSALRIPERACDFPLLRNVQTVSGAKTASYLIGTWRKRPRREVDHSLPYSAELTTSATIRLLPLGDRQRLALPLIRHKLNKGEHKKLISISKPFISSSH